MLSHARRVLYGALIVGFVVALATTLAWLVQDHPVVTLCLAMIVMFYGWGSIFEDSLTSLFDRCFGAAEKNTQEAGQLRELRAKHDVMKPVLRKIEHVRGSFINRTKMILVVRIERDLGNLENRVREDVNTAFRQHLPGTAYEIEVQPQPEYAVAAGTTTESK